MANSSHPEIQPYLLTYVPVVSMWVIATHSLFICSDLLPPQHPPSYCLRLFFKPNLSHINTPHLQPQLLHSYSPMKMENTVCSETLAFKLQMPVNHPEENIQIV
jgi:hypothetical protein